ncbi:hypothetical protein NHF46_04190 [Arthrobacter alpinus]|nr:hypothetical protein [Arthrobacter alpinus]
MKSDPENLLAELALQYHRYRKSDVEKDLRTYLEWIETRLPHCLSNAKPSSAEDVSITLGYRDLYRRLLLNYVVAALNIHDLTGTLDLKTQGKVVSQATALMKELDRTSPEPDLLRNVMRPVAAIAYEDLGQMPPEGSYATWLEAAKSSLSPWISYNMACHYAQPNSDKKAEMKKHLAIALLDPELKSWAKEDPSFLKLHRHEWFRVITGATAREIWEIEPFAAKKDTLAEVGIMKPSQLIPFSLTELQDHLALSLIKAKRLKRLASFALDVETAAVASGDKSFQSLHVEVTAALIDLGIETRSQIINDAETQKFVAKAIGQRCLIEIPMTDAESWLGKLTV